MPDLLENPAPVLSLEALAGIAGDVFGLSGTVRLLESERDLNALVETAEGRFVLKVANSAEPDGVLDFETAALNHIAAVDAGFPAPRVVPARSGASTGTVELDGSVHQVRVLTFLPGHHLPDGTIPTGTASAIGALLARLQRALRGFFHPLAGRSLLWDARRAHDLADWVPAIPDPAGRDLAGRVLREKAAAIPERLALLPAQVIHNDFNRDNLLSDPDRSDRLHGVVDFGDAVHGTCVQDLAVAATYAALEHPDPLAVVCAVVDGYCRDAGLETAEVEVLPDLISIRLAQSLAIAAHRATLHPANVDYILSDSAEVGAALKLWEGLDGREVRSKLARIAAVAPPSHSTPGLLSARRESLWSGLRLSYREPLHLVDSSGVWLFDADGRRYLDAYNNVAQVGHANRRVITAAFRQAERLNTNTRYLTDAVVNLAGQLTELLPDPLEVCFFVNSGSEATDLAWRIATTLTGRRGAIVTTHAYHGWTDAIYALSPEERPPDEAPDSVATMAAPGAEGPDAASALGRLAGAGHRPAALLIDATFSSDGIFAPPPGYLQAAAEAVRAEGGLFIADEVQGGLGRVGVDYWAFAADDLLPDIVTLGKPLGNGFPIGAVVTTREIADRFARAAYFFSTFGGNPVTAAAAWVVLDITAELRLPQRAEAVGRALREGLTEVMAQVPHPVEVRGRGAFVGVDLASGDEARAFVEALRAEGVLVGITGPADCVVKIRPPLIFDLEHVEQLLIAAQSAAQRIW